MISWVLVWRCAVVRAGRWALQGMVGAGFHNSPYRDRRSGRFWMPLPQKKFKELSGEARAELLRKILAVSFFGVLI